MSHRRLARIVSVAVLGWVVASTAFSQDAEQQAAAAKAKEAAARDAALRAQVARQAVIAAQIQAQAQAAGGIDPNSFAGKESTEGVYVRDSALALEKFALAQRMERLKEWSKSADVYQEVLEKYPDRVVPARTNDQDKIVQYTSVTRGVMEKLARWPKEGLDVYRARFEPTAAQLVEAATAGGRTDLAEMHKVFYRYFVTDTARRTGLRLIDVNLERGEFQSAARLADDLLNWHPGLTDERPAVLYRAALAHRLAGDEAKAKERLATIQKDHADAVGTVRGKEVKLAESLAHELAGVTTLGDGAVASADSWTTIGGDASRGRVTAAGGRPGARLFSVPLSRPQWRNVPLPQRNALEQALATVAAAGQTTGVFPVVDRGELFFQDGTRVYARSLESDIALPGWSQTYPGDRNGQYILPNSVGSPRTHQLTLTLTDRAVLGIMGQYDRSLTTVGINLPGGGEPRLVCLDRQTGKENWLVALGALELPKDLPDDQQKAIRGLHMNGSPLVVGDSVLVSARGIKQAQFEDCWVLCFHLGTGKYRWSSYVASASTVGAMFGGQQGQGFENTSHLAYANGRVYVLSNLGALAALDAYSGTIVWLDIYERGANAGLDPNFQFRGGGAAIQGPANKPWVYNPVVVKDGHVFALPTEGRNLYVYDASTGVEVKRIRRADFDNANVLLAVLDERMVIAGDKKIFCVNWRTYDVTNADASLVWASVDFPDGLRGRPFVTTDSVFVTDANRLSRLDLKGGRVVDAYPKAWKPWDEKEEGPGNVLVTADHVVIAGASQVHCYTDLTLARGKLDKDVAAAPEDAGTRLRYAEVLFTAGEHAGSIAKLDEAIKLLGGMATMRTGASRDRLFNDALAFAQKVAAGDADAGADEVRSPDSIKFANALYDRAQAAAATPQQHVHYRLSRARFADGVKDANAAARFYQEILSDADLRPVALLDEVSGGPTQAGAVAEGAIRSLIARAGSSIYESFEQEAGKKLAAAQATSPVKPDELLNVAQTFPNSKVAPQAMLAAADAYEAAGTPQPAVQVLRQMYFKYTDSPDKARIIESMARNYLALPNRVEVAAARLALGEKLFGEHKLTKALKLPDGREIAKDLTFTQALDEIRKYSGQAAAKNLPDFRLPVPPKYPPAAERKKNPRWPFPPAGSEQVIDGVATLALPLRDFARADRVVARMAGGQITVYKPGDATPVGTIPGPFELPRGSAWIGGGDKVLVWSNSAIALLPERGGEPVWRLELEDLPNVDIVKAGGDPILPDGVRVRGPNGLFINGRNVRRAEQAFVMQNGQLRALPQLPPGAVRPAPGGAEQVAEVRPVGDRALVTTTTGRILSVDLANGRVAWQTRLSDRPFDRVAANEDFTVLKISDETRVRLLAMDTFTGQIRGTTDFALQSGAVPLNIALSADGTLVYTLPDRLVRKDLYAPWDASDRDVTGVSPAPAGQSSAPPYINATGPEQLIIAEGRILALAEAGSQPTGNKKYVRVHSLETGNPITLQVPQDGGMVDLQLVAGTDSWDVKLRVIGPRLYVINPRTILCYNLDRPEQFWEGVVDDGDSQSVPNVKDAFFGQKHVVLLSEQLQQLQPQQGPPKPRHVLLAYARYAGKPNDTAESGRIDYESPVVEQQPITHWQGVEGGFYYLTADGKLHFLAAAQ